MIFSRGRRGAESELVRDGECAYKAMGTLTSYVGALYAGKSVTSGSAGFSWINIKILVKKVDASFSMSTSHVSVHDVTRDAS
jgi:hypothetical protein